MPRQASDPILVHVHLTTYVTFKQFLGLADAMDLEEFRVILSRSRVGIWGLIETAITFASSEYGEEFRIRRDKIVESLYGPAPELCQNCNENDDRHCSENRDDKTNSVKKCSINNNDRDSNGDFVSKSPELNNRNLSGGEEEEEEEEEQSRIQNIKDQLEDPDQSEDAVVELLQNLADMDITFHALKETDIGRHVNRFRKHSSDEVRRLVKQLVRKWKEAVDEWVKLNQPQAASNLIADEDSPQQNIPKNQQNGHRQVPDFGYSPNPTNGSSSAERKNTERETKPKPPQSAPRREAPSRPPQSVPKSAPAPPNRAPKESAVDDERLNSARRRLQENYKEAQNAKKQRTVQVMDIHEIPKPKNGFLAKNKGGFQGRHRR